MSEIIGIIGTGKVGTALSIAFVRKNFKTYIAGRTSDSLKYSVEISNAVPLGIDEIAKRATFIFLAVTDSEIVNVSRSLEPLVKESQVIVHLSGALDSSIISFLKGSVASLHPIKSFAESVASANSLPGTIFVCEGEEDAISRAKILTEEIGGKFMQIKSEDKAIYHLALSLASNFSVLILNKSVEILSSVGFGEVEAQSLALCLVKETLSNVEQFGLIKALTGPIERGDIQTIAMHIGAIQNKVFKEFYINGSLMLVDVAKKSILVDNNSRNYCKESKYDKINRLLKKEINGK